MDEKSTSGEPSGRPPPQGEQARLQDAYELLNEGQYKHVEQLLQAQQEAAQRSGQMAVAVFLAAACQICLTCQQFQAERELHLRAFEDAGRRERELRKQLSTIVEILSLDAPLETLTLDEAVAAPTPFVLEQDEPETDKPKGLLRRIQQRIGLEPSRPTTQRSHLVRSDAAEIDEKPALPATTEGDLQESTSVDAADLPVPQEEIETQLPPTPEEAPPQAKPKQWLDASFPRSEELSRVDQELLALMSQLPVAYLAERREKVDTPPSGPSVEVTDPDANDSPARALSPQEQQLLEAAVASLSVPPQIEAVDLSESETEFSSETAVTPTELGIVGQGMTEESIESETKAVDHVSEELLSTVPSKKSIMPTVMQDEWGDSDMPSLTVYCLGTFQAYIDDKPIENWSSGKGKAIFKYLVTHRERPIAKEVLMDLFWPDADPDSARNNLNVAIYGLRQALRYGGSDFSYVLFQNNCYLLNPDMSIWLDAEEFAKHFSFAKQLERDSVLEDAIKTYHTTEALYQGEFLAEDRYEEWLIPMRQQLIGMYFELLERLNQYYYGKEEYASCMNICRSLLRIDPCSEVTHRQLMLCYFRQGQQHLALRQYHHCARALRDELDVAPSPETAELYERIRRYEQF